MFIRRARVASLSFSRTSREDVRENLNLNRFDQFLLEEYTKAVISSVLSKRVKN
jgi:hypothetical protein